MDTVYPLLDQVTVRVSLDYCFVLYFLGWQKKEKLNIKKEKKKKLRSLNSVLLATSVVYSV